MRCNAELKPLLDRDAIVVIDAGGLSAPMRGSVIDSYVPGGVAGQWAVRLLGFGPRLCPCREAGPARPAGGAAAGRRRVRLFRHGVGHVGAPTAFHVVSVIGNNGIGRSKSIRWRCLRLFGGRRAAAGHPLRRGGHALAAMASWCRRLPRSAPRCSVAFDAGCPLVVNALTDPTVVYRAAPIWPDRSGRKFTGRNSLARVRHWRPSVRPEGIGGLGLRGNGGR